MIDKLKLISHNTLVSKDMRLRQHNCDAMLRAFCLCVVFVIQIRVEWGAVGYQVAIARLNRLLHRDYVRPKILLLLAKVWTHSSSAFTGIAHFSVGAFFIWTCARFRMAL